MYENGAEYLTLVQFRSALQRQGVARTWVDTGGDEVKLGREIFVRQQTVYEKNPVTCEF